MHNYFNIYSIILLQYSYIFNQYAIIHHPYLLILLSRVAASLNQNNSGWFGDQTQCLSTGSLNTLAATLSCPVLPLSATLLMFLF